MLRTALREQDFVAAARIRDARTALANAHPTAPLRNALAAALRAQDFATASALRDRLDACNLMLLAERAKPKFPMGLVVMHATLFYRMILFAVDYECSATRSSHSCRSALIERGNDQPWYHAAVDERDKTLGDNIVYVPEDDCCPAPEGMLIQHPITSIMFQGVYHSTLCPGLTCYIPCRDELDEHHLDHHAL